MYDVTNIFFNRIMDKLTIHMWQTQHDFIVWIHEEYLAYFAHIGLNEVLTFKQIW